jgi:hypothetical protein
MWINSLLFMWPEVGKYRAALLETPKMDAK